MWSQVLSNNKMSDFPPLLTKHTGLVFSTDDFEDNTVVLLHWIHEHLSDPLPPSFSASSKLKELLDQWLWSKDPQCPVAIRSPEDAFKIPEIWHPSSFERFSCFLTGLSESYSFRSDEEYHICYKLSGIHNIAQLLAEYQTPKAPSEKNQEWLKKPSHAWRWRLCIPKNQDDKYNAFILTKYTCNARKTLNEKNNLDATSRPACMRPVIRSLFHPSFIQQEEAHSKLRFKYSFVGGLGR